MASLWTRIQFSEKRILIPLAVVMVLVFAYVIVNGAILLNNGSELEKRGVPTTGIVTQQLSKGGLEFKWTVAGKTYSGRGQGHIAAGTPVPVHYVSDHPEIASLDTNKLKTRGEMVMVGGAIFGVYGFLILRSRMKRRFGERRA